VTTNLPVVLDCSIRPDADLGDEGEATENQKVLAHEKPNLSSIWAIPVYPKHRSGQASSGLLPAQMQSS